MTFKNFCFVVLAGVSLISVALADETSLPVEQRVSTGQHLHCDYSPGRQTRVWDSLRRAGIATSGGNEDPGLLIAQQLEITRVNPDNFAIKFNILGDAQTFIESFEVHYHRYELRDSPTQAVSAENESFAKHFGFGFLSLSISFHQEGYFIVSLTQFGGLEHPTQQYVYTCR